MTRRPITQALATALTAASLAALAGCGGGGPSGNEVRTATKAATLCSGRVNLGTVVALGRPGAAAPEVPLTGGSAAKPFYAATVVGVSGNPPMALGFRRADGGAVFAVVPDASSPGRDTPFSEVLDPATGASAILEVPKAKVTATERCFGGSAAG